MRRRRRGGSTCMAILALSPFARAPTSQIPRSAPCARSPSLGLLTKRVHVGYMYAPLQMSASTEVQAVAAAVRYACRSQAGVDIAVLIGLRSHSVSGTSSASGSLPHVMPPRPCTRIAPRWATPMSAATAIVRTSLSRSRPAPPASGTGPRGHM
jgi:hypothetical protein